MPPQYATTSNVRYEVTWLSERVSVISDCLVLDMSVVNVFVSHVSLGVS